MRITPRDRTTDKNEQLMREIAEAAAAKGVEGRICGPGCRTVCPKCGSTACQCMCSMHCPECPGALSSDREHYPVEPAILPLVFEMKRLDMFWPCWSCEGHLHPDGSLWKVPRVWFYCNSMIHVRLLSNGVSALKLSGKLSAPWQVIVTFSDDDNPDTTFSLEPTLQPGVVHELTGLQKDVAVIAGALDTMIPEHARKLQRNTGRALDRRR